MTHIDQIKALATDIHNVIDRYRQEFEVPVASVVGVLEIQSHLLIQEAASDMEEDDN